METGETHHTNGIEITDASGSRSPNGQHCFSTHVSGMPIFRTDGTINPALLIEVIAAGSLLRYPNGAWQAANWHLRVRGFPADAVITNARVRP